MADWRTASNIGVSGAVGGMFAALSDLVQKRDASAIKTIAETMQTTLEISFPPILAVLLVLEGNLFSSFPAPCLVYQATFTFLALLASTGPEFMLARVGETKA